MIINLKEKPATCYTEIIFPDELVDLPVKPREAWCKTRVQVSKWPMQLNDRWICKNCGHHNEVRMVVVDDNRTDVPLWVNRH